MLVDDTIRGSLERLVRPVEDTDEVLAQVERRRARQHRTRLRRRWLVAAASLTISGLGAMAAGINDADSNSETVTAGPADPQPGAAQSSGGAPRVTLSSSGLGPLRATSSDLRKSDEAWLEHTVTIVNTGTETIHLRDHRNGEFLGDKEVLAGDGCGYGQRQGGGEPVFPACATYLEVVGILPGGQHVFDITLWRDLDGMNQLTSSTLEFRVPIIYGPTQFSRIDQEGTNGELVFTYEHLDQYGQITPTDSSEAVPDPEAVAPTDIEDDRSYEMTPREAASVAGFPIRTFDPPTGWTLVRSEFQRIALPVADTAGTDATVDWFTQEFVPEGVDPDRGLYPALTVIQNSVQRSPSAIPPEAEQITLAGKEAFVSPAPEGVEQGGAISFWDAGGQYIINSNTLTVQELLLIAEQFASQDAPST